MTTELLTSFLDNFFDDSKVMSFRLMTQGKENTTVLVEMPSQRVIVRMWGETHGYMGVHSDNDIEDEVTFMNFCYENDIPVPRLFRSKSGKLHEKTSEGQCYTVMEYADGDSPQRFTQDMTMQVAKTMAHMHTLVAGFTFPQPRSWPGTILDMTNDRIKRFEAGELKVSRPELANIISHYKSLLKICDFDALPKGVIHGDIMWENIKFKDGKLQGIFDFGDCRESYFVEDVAKSLLFAFESPDHCIFGEDGKNVPVFLRAYQTVRPLTDLEKQSLPLFFLSRIIYQYLGYQAKIAKGQTEYESKANATIARYKQHEAFFNQESYE